MSFSYKLKCLLSYLSPLVIQRIDSEVSGILELTLHNGKLLLDTASANYSHGSLHHVFQKAINRIDFKVGKKKAIILGFGAGSIAKILNQEKELDLEIDGVDIDPVIFKIYKDHFKFKNDNCQLFEEDIFDYLKACKKSYDYIFIDVFVNLEVPGKILSKEFIDLIKQCSTENTSIIMNTMLSKDHAFVKVWNDSFDGETYFKNYHADNLVLFKV